MKRITQIFLSLALILSSCHKDPKSSFSADNSEPEVGQTVVFTNHSHNGEKYEWDFGDGFVSNDPNPSHIFSSTGSYEVTLTVTSGGSSDVSSLTITVQVPTLLQIEVREYSTENVVPNASVLLYPTLPDWDAQTNSVMEGITGSDGIAVFTNLDAFVYYLDVWETTHDNYTLRNEDVGWIRTPEVLAHKITSFIAYVDIANHSGVTKDRTMVIKKLVRKPVEKAQTNPYPENLNWKDLYSRRTVK